MVNLHEYLNAAQAQADKPSFGGHANTLDYTGSHHVVTDLDQLFTALFSDIELTSRFFYKFRLSDEFLSKYGDHIDTEIVKVYQDQDVTVDDDDSDDDTED